MRDLRLAIALAALLTMGSVAGASVAEALSEADLRALESGGAGVDSGGVALVTQASAEAPAASDPMHGQLYRVSVAVYAREGTDWWHRFTVHCATRDDLPLARKVGGLLGSIWMQAGSRFGALCARLREKPIDVWLTRTGSAGGEHWRTDIYLTDIGTARNDIEWAREVAHEYGHYLLPGASGYTDPESWANGVLGERLLLSWLSADAKAHRTGWTPPPFVTARDLDDYVAKQVTPLLNRAAAPAALPLGNTGRGGFDAFTALMLYADSVYGSSVLMNLLEYLPQTRTQPARGPDFERALDAWLDGSAAFTTCVPTGQARYVYIPRGTYRVRAVSGSATAVDAEGATMESGSGGWVVRNARARRLSLTVTGAPADVTLRWTRQ